MDFELQTTARITPQFYTNKNILKRFVKDFLFIQFHGKQNLRDNAEGL